MKITTTPDGIQTISSREIAKITGKNHADVMRDIRATLEKAEIVESIFAGYYIATNGKKNPCYLLPRRECDLVISGYSVKYRLAIIDRWRELESMVAARVLPTPIEIARNYLASLEHVEVLEAKIAIDAPKVNFHDTVMASESVCQMAVACQTAQLPFGRNMLYQKLREKGVLIDGGNRHNLPTQKYVDRGLFVVKERAFEHPKTGEPFVSFTTYCTQKGLDWIIKNFA